jgi:dipeptidyl aminopeptidase/acylaminoacyl peptidase
MRTFGIAATWLLAMSCAGAAAARESAVTSAPVASSLSPDAFFTTPTLSNASLSPSGRFMAYLLRNKDQADIVVEDLVGDTRTVALHNVGVNLSFDWLTWKTDTRLVVGVSFMQFFHDNAAHADSKVIGWSFGKYMVAVDRDGNNQTILFKGDKGTAYKTGNIMRLMDPLKTDPDHILAILPYDNGDLAVWKADVHTGAAMVVEKGDGGTLGWDSDRNGAIVARYRLQGRELTIEGRSPGEATWTQITKLKPRDLVKELADFELIGSAEAPGSLYVAAKPTSPADGDTRSVHVYDFRTHSLGPAVWPHTPYDVASIVTARDSNALEGVCYWVDTYQCDFKDAAMQATLRGIATYFHHERNVTPLSWSDDGKWWLFNVTGPDQPGAYYLYDWNKRELRELGEQFPDLPSARLGRMQTFVYTTHDGVDIHGYLTRPPGAPSGPLPMVVIPHGGPMVRDQFDFDLWSQFIATRGYLVYQPNFRGSGGYGQKWLESGFREWGGKMQDDVAEGVKALIASGQADPARICVFGGSYGGYTALMQGAQHPDIYKCVVSWAGISDLPKQLKFDRNSDGSSNEVFKYEVKEIGDPDTDKAALMKQSAVTYAATYGPPVLLVHGDADTNVPVEQSREMEHALRAANRDVRLIIASGENHTGWADTQMKEKLGQVADFIAAHIKPAALTAAPN